MKGRWELAQALGLVRSGTGFYFAESLRPLPPVDARSARVLLCMLLCMPRVLCCAVLRSTVLLSAVHVIGCDKVTHRSESTSVTSLVAIACVVPSERVFRWGMRVLGERSHLLQLSQKIVREKNLRPKSRNCFETKAFQRNSSPMVLRESGMIAPCARTQPA